MKKSCFLFFLLMSLIVAGLLVALLWITFRTDWLEPRYLDVGQREWVKRKPTPAPPAKALPRQPLSQAFNGTDKLVSGLVVDPAGKVYLTGRFSLAGGIETGPAAAWDPAGGWQRVGPPLTQRLGPMAVDSRGNLYAAGPVEIGGVNVYKIARWDGLKWNPLSTGIGSFGDEAVEAIAVDERDRVLIRGSFHAAGGLAADGLARWDGSRWEAISPQEAAPFFPELNANDVYAVLSGGNSRPMEERARRAQRGLLAFLQTQYPGWWIVDSHNTLGADGRLYTAVSYEEPNGPMVVNLVMDWDGRNWREIGRIYGKDARIFQLVASPDGSLYAAGSFSEISGVSAANIARWDGETWSALGRSSALNGQVWSLVPAPGGGVYAGGDFTRAGESAALHVAYWDHGWEGVCGGLSERVVELAVDSAGKLWAASHSQWSDKPVPPDALARCVGTGWQSFPVDGLVLAVAAGKDGRVYAGGNFTQVDGVEAKHVAVWDGQGWRPLGPGLEGNVLALAVNAAGQVIAAENDVVEQHMLLRLMKWDGQSWSSISPDHRMASASGSQLSILPFEEKLVFTGWFQTAGENGLALWDGARWQYPQGSKVLRVDASTVDRNGIVYAGGLYRTGETHLPTILARWTGQDWEPLAELRACRAPGCSSSPRVTALAVGADGWLYAGGSFTAGEGQVSLFFAAYPLKP